MVHQTERDRSRSNGKTTAKRVGAVVEAVVAGVERHELAGGEVLRAGAGAALGRAIGRTS